MITTNYTNYTNAQQLNYLPSVSGSSTNLVKLELITQIMQPEDMQFV